MDKTTIFLTTVVLILAGLLVFLVIAENPKKVPDKPTPAPPQENLPKVAIIIDDIGNDFQVEKDISKIDANLTLAILPFRQDTQKAMNYFSDRELLLHLPLEPIDKKYFEERMLKTSMSQEQIKSEFEKYLSALKGKVKGVNNHKGSRFTSNKRAMSALLQEVRQNNLYFVDSFTIASSVGYELAKEMKVPTARRDVFLDNSDKKEEIKSRLEELIATAKKEGSAIGIGHGRAETISVLIQELPRYQDEISFVPASKLVN